MFSSPGPVILDLLSTELSAEEQEILQHPLVGGLILFSRNYESPEQLAALCQKVRESRKAPLLITVDHEGGRVQRFKEGFTTIPPMGDLGDLFDNDSSSALNRAEACGWLMAAELLSLGVDLSFAPVLDLNKQKNTVIANRAFHANPETVILLASAFISGMRQARMSATGKHFPGHGSVAEDSHAALPIDNRQIEQIIQDDLRPFAALLANGLDAVMPAHILFPQIDEMPVGFSRIWLQNVLRQQLKFSGVIFSDDLTMEGAASMSPHYHQRAEAALNAGCDMVLVCNNRAGAINILENYSGKHELNATKFKSLQGHFSENYTSLRNTRLWREKSTQLLKIQDKL